VEFLGLLKLDILGIRMQSAMSYAVAEIARVDGAGAVTAGEHEETAGFIDGTGHIDLDAVPHDDPATFALIQSTRTLGCFQIESPGQRELVGKFAPETFHDLIIDISLFRPGPVKSDMITPFLRARQGWSEPEYLHPALRPVLEDTCGVVVFHEQVLQIVSIGTGCDLAEADEFRRAMGVPAMQEKNEKWFRHHAARRRTDEGERVFDNAAVDRIWAVLKAFASFGFCKAHAAAFALPTYQSAWLKAHHPAAFLAGVLTHDPGMYPKRLILDDARNFGIAVLPLDVNHSDATYRVERIEEEPESGRYGIRLALAEVKGINDAEVERIVANRPYPSLADFWHRAQVSRPIVERLVITGAFDSVYGLTDALPVQSRGRTTRRDLLLQLADLERWSRSLRNGPSRKKDSALPRTPTEAGSAELVAGWGKDSSGVRRAAGRQAQSAAPVLAAADQSVQLALDLGDAPDRIVPSGLPEMTSAERTRAELEVLGLDASRHVLEFYEPMLKALQVTRARDVRGRRSRAEILVAGVKVATQTPPIRTGRRVVFLTLDDSTGPVDATFFEDVQGPYAATVFHSWLLVVRGVLRKTGHRGVSLRATGAWELPVLWEVWVESGLAGVLEILHTDQPTEARATVGRADLVPADAGGPTPGRVLGISRDDGALPGAETADWEVATGLPSGDRGGPPGRRVLVHPSGFRQSPYADLRPPGGDTRETRRMLAAEQDSVQDERRRREEERRHHQRSGAVDAASPAPAADHSPEGEDTAKEQERLRRQEETRRRREPPRKLWHSSPGSSGR
jgi:error-prone DNA polymerase